MKTNEYPVARKAMSDFFMFRHETPFQKEMFQSKRLENSNFRKIMEALDSLNGAPPLLGDRFRHGDCKQTVPRG